VEGLKVADLKNIIGQNVKKIRKSRKWTQAQLAEKVGIEPVSIARIEAGTNFPKEENLAAIAETLDVEVVDLFNDRSTDKKSTLKYIQNALNTLDKRDLEIISNIVRTMTCC